MTLLQDDFLNKYNISIEEFTKADISYKKIKEIQEDYCSKFPKFDDAGANLVRILLRFEGVHSVKYRIKDPEHLAEKIIRKKIKNPKLDITINNYQDNVQDLIGIRILHLFKSDWLTIHNQLNRTFKQLEKPEANIRKGDLETLFKSNGCKVKIHPAGYRSVHYLIITEPTLKPYTSEVQVRTIFEEAWSEIDHKVRYPYFTENNTINQFLNIFNRLSGSADEMGEFVIMLKAEILLNQRLLEKSKNEIEALKEQINKSTLDKKTKEDLSGGLDNLNLSNYSRLTTNQQAINEAVDSFIKSREIANNYLSTKSILNGLSSLTTKSPLISSLSSIDKLLTDASAFERIVNGASDLGKTDSLKKQRQNHLAIEENSDINNSLNEQKK